MAHFYVREQNESDSVIDIEQVLWELGELRSFVIHASDPTHVGGWFLKDNRLGSVLGQQANFSNITACYEQVVKALGAVGPSNRGTDTGSGSVEPAHRASSGLIPEERRVPGGSTSSCLRREGLRTTVGMASSPVGAGASGFYAAIDSSLHTWSASNAVRFLTTANA